MWQSTPLQSKPFKETLISEQLYLRQPVANGENSCERSLSVKRYSHFFHFPTTSSFYVTFTQALIESVTTTSP